MAWLRAQDIEFQSDFAGVGDIKEVSGTELLSNEARLSLQKIIVVCAPCGLMEPKVSSPSLLLAVSGCYEAAK